MAGYKEIFRKQGRSEEFMECLEHLESIQEIVESLPENEAAMMRSYVRNVYKGDENAPKNKVSLNANEMDALLNHNDGQEPL